ncbi:MAG TPA: TSUP family transporter [Opitutaceae bacterium]
MDLPLWLYPLLFLTGFAAGLVDAIAGGGGLIAVPVLLNLGLPVPVALGTSKLQSSFGSLSASVHYLRSGVVRLRDCRVGIVASITGSLIGAAVVHSIDSGLLETLIPWLLAAIVVYAILQPRAGSHEHPPRMPAPLFFLITGLMLGFYDGFFGPGAGSFWTVALIAVMGYDFMRATGTTKIVNASSALAALGYFVVAGHVHYAAGLTMGAGQVVGARIGSGMVVKKGARFVRPVFLTMVVLVMLRLLWVAHARR